MFTEDQHRKTGNLLQVIHNQLCFVATNIRNSTPANTALYQRSLLLSPFNNPESCPLTVLRRILDNEAHKEISPRGPLKMYFKACQPDFHCPNLLLGVPEQLAKEYKEKARARDYFKGNKKPRLDQEEMKAINIFLFSCRVEINIIGESIIEHYGPDHPAVQAAAHAVRVNHDLAVILQAVRDQEAKS